MSGESDRRNGGCSDHAVADRIFAISGKYDRGNDRKEIEQAVKKNRGRIVITGILILAAFLIGYLVGYCCGKDG